MKDTLGQLLLSYEEVVPFGRFKMCWKYGKENL